MNSANYISNAEFADMNPELDLSNYSPLTISGMIQRASAQMDNYLEYSLGIEEISSEKSEAIITREGNLMVFTRKFPVVSVSAISLKLGTVSLDLTLTDGSGNARYDIPYRARSVTYPYQEISMTGTFSVRNFMQIRGREIFSVISYRAGFETIPSDLKDACSLITRDIFIRQANPQDLSSATQGATSQAFRAKDEVGDSSWVKQAKEIMKSYRRLTA